MLSVKAREAADTIFKVFGMTQLRIKPSLPCLRITVTAIRVAKQVSIAFFTRLHMQHCEKTFVLAGIQNDSRVR